MASSDEPKNGHNKIDTTDLVHNERNAKLLICQRCQSKILKPDMGRYVENEFFVPSMKKKSDSSGSPDAGETLSQFWLVEDIYHFENVGFSNTVDSTKYLTCADCEIGPIGVHDLPSKKSYVALDRVRHELDSSN